MATQTKKMPKKQNKFIAAFFRRDVEGKYHMSDGFFGFLLTVPAILVLLTVIAAPILKGIYMSFMKYGLKEVSGKAAPVWNNFKNYTDLFRAGGINGNVVDYFLTTLQFVFWAVLVQFVIGLALALPAQYQAEGTRRVPRSLPRPVDDPLGRRRAAVASDAQQQLRHHQLDSQQARLHSDHRV